MDQTKLVTYGMSSELKENKVINHQGNKFMIVDGLKYKSDNSNKSEKRRRRGKKECEGRDFVCCECGKAYLSAPAMLQHRKTKHNYFDNSSEKRGRGRPKKNSQLTQELLIENTEQVFKNFFDFPKRRKRDSLSCLIIKDFIECVFIEIYVKYKNFLPCKYENVDDIALFRLIKEKNSKEDVIKERNCDDCFYDYLKMVSEKANQEYFLFAFKFCVLFRECVNKYKAKDMESGMNYTEYRNADLVPDLCNEFITDYMEDSKYFGMDSIECKNEFIEIIQHFCFWLYDIGYTNSRLTLMPQEYNYSAVENNN